MIEGESKQELLEKLLEAVGYDVRSVLDEISIDELRLKFVRANEVLQLTDEIPDIDELESTLSVMIESSCNQEDQTSSEEFDSLTTAIKLNDEFIEKNGVEVADLPAAKLVHESHHSVVEKGVKIPTRTVEEAVLVQEFRPSKADSQGGVTNAATANQSFKVSGQSKFSHSRRGFEAARRMEPYMNDTKSEDGGDIQSPSSKINQGLDASTKRYIRGILHRRPSVMVGSTYAYLFVVMLVVLSVIPIGYIVIEGDYFYVAILTPLMLVGAAVVQLTKVRGGACPVCRQAQYAAKHCSKHDRAHHLPLLGYRVPTALHLLRYKWFRCIFCGTSIRVKE